MKSSSQDKATPSKAIYERLWGQVPEYRQTSAADFLTPIFLQYFPTRAKDRVIDFGCGPGRSVPFLLKASLQIELIDFASNCLDVEIFLKTFKEEVRFWETNLWDLPAGLKAAEWGICFDVLEHIPTERVEEVLSGMAKRIKNGGLLAIDLGQDTFGSELGQQLHLTIQPSSWWREKISRFFSIQEALLETEEKLLLAVKT